MLTATKDLTETYAQCAQPALELVEPVKLVSASLPPAVHSPVDLLNTYARYTKPPLAIDTTKPLPPESLAEFSIAYRLVKSPESVESGFLDKRISPDQMTIRELAQMGITFQIV